MSEENIEKFIFYCQQYRYEENEYISSMFLERSFKYVEIEYIDSFTKKPIQSFPIYSSLCLDKKTASICIFDASTIFSLLFQTKSDQNEFENLLNSQVIQCPCCKEEISFNFLVYDNFLASLHQYIKNMKLKDGVIAKLKLERVRKSNTIKYSLSYPIQNNFSGEVTIQEKINIFSIDQYQRMQQELEKEILDLQNKKNEGQQNQGGLEQEIRMKQTVQNIIAEEHNRKSDQPSTYLDEQQPFRILKVGGIDGTDFKSIENRKIYTFKENQLLIGQPSNQFEKRFQIYNLFIKKNNKIISFNINIEEFKGFKSILVYDSIIVIVTARKIYQIQLINGQNQDNIENQLLVEELYTINREVQDEQVVPQMCFNRGNLFLMEYSEQQEKLILKIIEDLFVYPEERILAQPQVYLEVSQVSNKEKVLLLSDDFTGNIMLLTLDQYFVYDLLNDKWEETDLELQSNKIDFKPKFNYYDYQQNKEFDSGQKQVNYFDDSEEEEEEQKNMGMDYDSDEEDEELDHEDMLERIFENSHEIFGINTKSKVFHLCNIKKGYITQLNLNKQKIKQTECVLNENISSENTIYKDKAFFYAIKVQEIEKIQYNLSNEQDDQYDDIDLTEAKFNEYLTLKSIPSDLGNRGQENTFYNKATFCKDYAIFSTSTFV